MEKIYKGGYAEVFYDSEKDEIFRTLSKYHPKTKELDISTIGDLIFTRSLDYTGHTPVIHSEVIGKDKVTYRMPHYGMTLQEWVRKTTLEERWQHAAHMMDQIVTGCIYLEANGFMHTDLKPSNIMVSKEPGGPRVRIIDFNCISVREVQPKDPGAEWTPAVGTWNYCAPEIILHETPFHTSPSWSLALLAAYILDRYAFIDSITTEMNRTLVDQQVWCDLMDHWAAVHTDHPPLLRSEYYGDAWGRLIHEGTQWSVHTRWTLPQIRQYIREHLLEGECSCSGPGPGPSAPEIHAISHMIDVSAVVPDLRRRAVAALYGLCEKMGRMNLFPAAMAIVDRVAPLLDSEMLVAIETVSAAAYLLGCAMYGLSVFSSRPHMSKILNHAGCVHRSIVTMYMFHLGELLSWRLWEKPAHVWVVDQDRAQIQNDKLFPYLRDAFLSQTGSYTQKGLAEEVLARLRAEAA